jgi:pilus assembly protein CpaB
MSRRSRAGVFLLFALVSAAVAAGVANGYGSSVTRGYGPLRPVVVARTDLPAGAAIGPREVESGLAVRRVPERFTPPGALISPQEALGRVPAAALPAGSYLQAAQMRTTRRRPSSRGALGPDRSPVEISVSGADALRAAGPLPAGARVDVVVSGEPLTGGSARTYVAAADVPLLALRPSVDDAGAGGSTAATLGLTRHQALRLIGAESAARRMTLLPGG